MNVKYALNMLILVTCSFALASSNKNGYQCTKTTANTTTLGDKVAPVKCKRRRNGCTAENNGGGSWTMQKLLLRQDKQKPQIKNKLFRELINSLYLSD